MACFNCISIISFFFVLHFDMKFVRKFSATHFFIIHFSVWAGKYSLNIAKKKSLCLMNVLNVACKSLAQFAIRMLMCKNEPEGTRLQWLITYRSIAWQSAVEGWSTSFNGYWNCKELTFKVIWRTDDKWVKDLKWKVISSWNSYQNPRSDKFSNSHESGIKNGFISLVHSVVEIVHWNSIF